MSARASLGDEAAPNSPPNSPLGAAGWMVGSMLSFTLMAVAGRELSTELNTFQLMFWRSVVGCLVVSSAVALSARGFGQVRTRRPGLHSTRNLCHFFGQNCWFYALGAIPLAQVFAFEFTSPIWVAVLAPLVLGEQFTKWRALAAALGFLGVLLVARPGGSEFGLGHVIGLAAAIGFAGSFFATKALSSTETTLSILFWMTLSQAGMALVCDLAVSGGAGLIPSDPVQAGWLAAVGVLGLSAHFSITSALKLADATVVAPLDFFRLPLVAVVGMMLYGEPLELAVVLGGALVFLGNFLNLRAERRRTARAAPTGDHA